MNAIKTYFFMLVLHSLYLAVSSTTAFAVQNGPVLDDDFSLGELVYPWIRWQSTPETAHLEDGALMIATNAGWQVVQQRIFYEPGQRYRIIFDGKSLNTRLRADVSDFSSGILMDYSLTPAGSNWRSHSLFFTAPKEIGHRIFLRFYPQDRFAVDGKIWIDNVFAQSLKIENMVQGGDFSLEELIYPWIRWQSTPETAHLEDGALMIATNADWQVVQQRIFYEPGQRYRITFDGKSLNTRLRADVSDFSSGVLMAYSLTPAGSNWGTHSLFFSAPEGANHQIYLRLYPHDRLAVDGKIWVDNVFLQPYQMVPTDNLGKIWEKEISPIIRSINVESAGSLYNSQIDLMSLVEGVFSLERIHEQEELLLALTTILRKLPHLNEVRSLAAQGSLVLEEMLSNPERSGHNDRRIFPTKTSGGAIYYDSSSTLQFSCLISHVAKTIAKYRNYNYLSRTELNFLDEAVPFLHNELVIPTYSEVEAWWYAAAGGNFPNMKAYINAKLDFQNHPELQGKSYYKAFTDFEILLFSNAANLEYIATRYPGKFLINEYLIDEILDKCYQMMTQRLSPNGFFLFDVGAWDDHPDHAYASYDGQEYPDKKYPAVNGTLDSSHSHRFPWLLKSYRDAYLAGTERYIYYNNLLKSLADQFYFSVVEFTDKGPFLNNYMSGNNGWYRVGPEWGYGPYTLSNTAIWGTWYALGEISENVRTYNRAMATMVRSVDPEVIQFRTTYFGERDYQFSVDPSGLRSIDLLGVGTRFELYIILGERMSLF